jgi:hypothetical protein
MCAHYLLLSKSLKKERQRTSKNQQEYLVTIKVIATQKGQARQFDEIFSIMM